MSEKTKVKAKVDFTHAGQEVKKGDTLEVSEGQAKIMLDMDLIEKGGK